MYRAPSVGLVLPEEGLGRNAMMELLRLLQVRHDLTVQIVANNSRELESECSIVIEHVEPGKESIAAEETVRRLEAGCKPEHIPDDLMEQKPFHRAAILAKQGEKSLKSEEVAKISHAQQQSQVVVVCGMRGSGKSSLLGFVCSQAGFFVRDGTCIGAHFFSMRDEASLSVRSCLFSLSRQIASCLPDVVDVNETRASEMDDLLSLFRTLIASPCTQCKPPGGKRFVVVDNFDDSDEAPAFHSNVHELWAKECPSWLGIVLSCRSGTTFSSTACYTLSGFQISPINMRASLVHRLRSVVRGEENAELLFSMISSLSKGFWPLAATMVQELERRTAHTPAVTCGQLRDALGKLPESIRADLELHFKKLVSNAPNRETCVNLLCAIAASRRGWLDWETVVEILGDMSAKKEHEWVQLLQGAFLVRPYHDDSLRIIHPWLKEALKKLPEMSVQEGHMLLSNMLAERPFSSFALQYLSFHLRHAGKLETLVPFLLSFKWLLEATSLADNVYQLIEDSLPLMETNDLVRGVLHAIRCGSWYITNEGENRNAGWLPTLAQFLIACIPDKEHPVLQEVHENYFLCVLIPTSDWLIARETLPLDGEIESIVQRGDIFHVMDSSGRSVTVDIETDKVLAVFKFGKRCKPWRKHRDDDLFHYLGMLAMDNKLIAWNESSLVAIDGTSGRPLCDIFLFSGFEKISQVCAGTTIIAVLGDGQTDCVLVVGVGFDSMHCLTKLHTTMKPLYVGVSPCDKFIVSASRVQLEIWHWAKSVCIRTVCLSRSPIHVGISGDLAWCATDEVLAVYGVYDESKDSSSQERQGIYQSTCTVLFTKLLGPLQLSKVLWHVFAGKYNWRVQV